MINLIQIIKFSYATDFLIRKANFDKLIWESMISI